MTGPDQPPVGAGETVRRRRNGAGAGPHCDPGASEPTTGLWAAAAELDEETRRLLAVRLAELLDFQNERYARGLPGNRLAIACRERRRAPCLPAHHAATRTCTS